MGCLLQFLHFLFIACLLICSRVISDQISKSYVVYMGNSAPNSIGVDGQVAESVHLQLLTSIIPRMSERKTLIHHFSHAFSGFSAMLMESEALALSGIDLVS